MGKKYVIIIVGVSIIVAFAVGRSTSPTKVRIEKQVVEVEKKTKDTEIEKHKETKTVETTRPDGTKETTTVTIEDSNKKKNETSDKSKSETDVSETTYASSKVTILGLVGAPLHLGLIQPIYGASVSKPILGPIVIGAWGLSNSTAGVSLGLTF